MLYESVLECPPPDEALAPDPNDERSLFQVVRTKVQRYLTTVPATRDPTPLDWIFDSRSYGLRIRYTTAVAGHIEWEGSQISFRDVQLTMEALSEGLHAATAQLRRLLLGLLFCSGPTEAESVPAIPWDRLYDDVGNIEVGYGFWTDPRNDWARAKQDWLARRVLGPCSAREAWVYNEKGALASRPEAIHQYRSQVDAFRELLYALVHFLSGQPARSTELLGARYVNTAYGGARNVFVQNRLVCIAPSYHKGYSRQQALRTIHRYLPRELGSLFVLYLWLVLPFCQQVEALLRPGLQPSPFLWGRAILDSVNRRPPPEADPLFLWPPEKMRRQVELASTRYLGTRITVSAWRHIAIAIARRYCRGIFGGLTPDNAAPYNDSDSENEGGLVDDAWDLQAGHTSYIGGAMYGREAHQGRVGLAGLQEEFREKSTTWHRFLGFGEADRPRLAKKRRPSSYKRDRSYGPTALHGSPRPTSKASCGKCWRGPKPGSRANRRRAASRRTRGFADRTSLRHRRGQEHHLPPPGLLLARGHHHRRRPLRRPPRRHPKPLPHLPDPLYSLGRRRSRSRSFGARHARSGGHRGVPGVRSTPPGPAAARPHRGGRMPCHPR